MGEKRTACGHFVHELQAGGHAHEWTHVQNRIIPEVRTSKRGCLSNGTSAYSANDVNVNVITHMWRDCVERYCTFVP